MTVRRSDSCVDERRRRTRTAAVPDPAGAARVPTPLAPRVTRRAARPAAPRAARLRMMHRSQLCSTHRLARHDVVRAGPTDVGREDILKLTPQGERPPALVSVLTQCLRGHGPSRSLPPRSVKPRDVDEDGCATSRVLDVRLAATPDADSTVRRNGGATPTGPASVRSTLGAPGPWKWGSLPRIAPA